ncbi:MAG: rhamnulokinase [Chloroflexi bacterium]|nr:rhamnulokinase [Chloroflexota bacterium]
MTAPVNLLAFDLGAESGRAMLGALTSGRLELREIYRFANQPVRLPDGLHWDLLHLWSEILTGLERAARLPETKIASIGLDTWGVDFALLDSAGTLMGLPYHYRDSRTDGMPEAAFLRVPREEIFAATGIQFMQINTLYQLFAMVQQQSPALEAASSFLTIPDLVNYWLSGSQVNEFSNATTTQCYDPRQGDWAYELITRLGIPPHIFGPIVQPGTVIGSLRAELARDAGTAQVPIVAPACHDTGSAVAAVPAYKPGFAWISSGTWSVMGAEWPEPLINAQSLAFNITNEGGVGGTFRVSKNIMGLWLVQQCRHTWAQEGSELSYNELTSMAQEAPAFAAVVDPDYQAFLPPGDMPERIRGYCRQTGQAVPETKGAIIRCVLEGLALKYRWVLEHLEQMLGTRLEPIHIVGGGTQNELLSQFTADCTGRQVVAGPVEATAMGNLLVQAQALGQLGSLSALREVVRNSSTVRTYVPHPSAFWDRAFSTLSDLIRQG